MGRSLDAKLIYGFALYESGSCSEEIDEEEYDRLEALYEDGELDNLCEKHGLARYVSHINNYTLIMVGVKEHSINKLKMVTGVSKDELARLADVDAAADEKLTAFCKELNIERKFEFILCASYF
jgi:hypothetical protein